MIREKRLLPNGIPKNVRIYDNGKFDRYTVVYTGNYKDHHGCEYLGMSDNPTHPQGFGQHGWSNDVIDRPKSSYLGRKIEFEDLPEKCQELVLNDYKEIWNLK